MPRISVIDPIGPAFSRMVAICFKPFDIGKWFLLGFCAFLAYLGQYAGNAGGNFPGGFPGGGGGGGVPGGGTATDWIKANLGAITMWGLIILVLLALVIALFTWIQSRGRFMFLDGVVRNRGAVVEPWKMHRELGNSLFAFSYIITLVAILLWIGIGILVLAVMWPDLARDQFDSAALTAVILGGVLAIGLGLAGAVISALLDNFVIPTMYVRNERVMAAWSTCNREVLGPHTGPVVLFLLMKFLLSMVLGTVAMVMTCATCCLTAIPYLGTVILLPLIVFPRCYSLCFLEQFGPSWAFFVDQDLLHCRQCGYDLRGSYESGICAECGYVFRAPPPPPPPPPAPPMAPPPSLGS